MTKTKFTTNLLRFNLNNIEAQPRKFPRKLRNGFTLLEIIVVISIITLFTTLLLANYRGGEKQLALLRSSHKLAQDLRVAQEMAMSSKKFNGVVPEGGYGIYFTEDQNSYILFADCGDEPDKKYSGANEKVRDLFLESGIKISKLDVIDSSSDYSSLSITFLPPDPIIFIEGDSNSKSGVIYIASDTREKTISINSIGSIDID